MGIYNQGMADFKPNIYPIMYWGLMYGLIAGFLLFIIYILSRYLTLVWFPVFLAGVIWGGYRNYRKQKKEAGGSQEKKTPMEEFKEAAKDIVGATREMVAEQVQESVEQEAAEQEIAESEASSVASEELPVEETPATEAPSAEPAQPESQSPPEVATDQPIDSTPPEDTTIKPGPPPPATQ